MGVSQQGQLKPDFRQFPWQIHRALLQKFAVNVLISIWFPHILPETAFISGYNSVLTDYAQQQDNVAEWGIGSWYQHQGFAWPDGMVTWVECPSPILGDRGFELTGLNPNDVKLDTRLLPSLVLGIIRIGQELGWLSVSTMWLSGISGQSGLPVVCLLFYVLATSKVISGLVPVVTVYTQGEFLVQPHW